MVSQAVLMPASLAELTVMLSRHPEAGLLAGGTLAIPRWQATGAPKLAITVGRVAELTQRRGCECGAAVTLAQVAADAAVPAVARQAAASVGGPALRSLATIGGNVVAASPGCLAVAMLALNGQARWLTDARESRWLPMSSASPPAGSVLTRLRWPGGRQAVFQKLTIRTAGGQALASVAVSATASDADWIVAAGGPGIRPHVLRATADLLAHGCRDAREIAAAAGREVRLEGLAEEAGYRRHLVGTLVGRAAHRLLGCAR